MIAIMSDVFAALFEGGSEISLNTNETLFCTADRVRFMYLVTKGKIDLVRHTKAGARMILQRAVAGQVLAEGSAYSKSYHCDGTASEASKIRRISVAVFRERIEASPAISTVWSASLALALQKARMNAEIRTLRTVAERLDAWAEGERSLPPKGRWQELAQILGVSPEALYRELAKRRL